MSKLLLVEDDKTIVENLCVFLQQEGFFVESVFGQKQAIELLEEKYYDLVLLDISLADGNGFAICSYIKQNTDIPVIFLTASGDEYSVVTGLDMGADDYIAKPFGMMEFIARVRAVLRRGGLKGGPSELIYKNLRIRSERHQVFADDEEIVLTLKEYELLKYLIENQDIVLTRNQILGRVWGYDFDGETRTVDVHIRTLRQKLGEYGKYIETVRGVGYRIGG